MKSITFTQRDPFLTTTGAAAALAPTAAAAATATDPRGVVSRGGDASTIRTSIRNIRRGAKVIVGLDLAATRLLALLVGLRRQLQHLAELHALVGLHRLLNVREPSHFV